MINKRLLIVFLLGFSSGLPLSLLTTTLQAWYSVSGMSVLATGMLSLVGLPYLYRIFWGPILDRYELCALGRRRSWMLLTQLMLLLGFNGFAWLNPQQSPQSMALLALVLAFFSATQDTVIDAQRTEYLPIHEHAIGASLAVFGYRIGLLFSGGLSLVLAQHIGWVTTYRLMGTAMLVGVVATLWSKEPQVRPQTSVSLLQSYIAPVRDLFSRSYFIPLTLFILFYKLGEAFTATTSGIVMPFLINGLGFSLATIGYINKILGMSAILVGGLTAGLLLMRWSLYRALWVFGLMQASSNLLFIALAMVGKNALMLAIAVTCDNFAAGMGSTALVALLMRLVNQRFTATQFSILVAISSIPRVFSGPLAGFIQLQMGWIGLYELSFLLALGFMPFLRMIRGSIEETFDQKMDDSVNDIQRGNL